MEGKLNTLIPTLRADIWKWTTYAVITLVTLISSTPLSAEENKSRITPDQAKALEYWTDSLALQAATWGEPLVVMYLLRYNDAVGPQAKAKPNTIWRMENISTPKLAEEAGYVWPNVNTIYGFGFMDLRQEPIILTLPDSHDLYYMVEVVDMWTNAFAYPAGKKAGYKGGKYALVGPNWKGTLPTDVTRIDAPTPWILLQPRVHLTDQADLANAQTVLKGITTQGLAAYTGQTPPPAPNDDFIQPQLINPKLPVSALDFRDPLQFWEILSVALNENPPPKDQIDALLPMYQPLGLEFGKVWDRSKIDPIVLKSMRQSAEKIAPTMVKMPFATLLNGWFLYSPNAGDWGTNYKYRAICARVGLTANTASEAIYFTGTADGEGQPLTGAKRYTMTWQKAPPVVNPGFWSVTLYDNTNSYPVPNPINRYALGGDNKDLKYNPDGSLTMYLQTESPGKDKESNWLPTPPGEYTLIMRAYAPSDEMVKALSDPQLFVPPPAVQVP